MNKVVVTGACGFIGSHLVDRLVTDGHEITVIDNHSTSNKHYHNPKAKYVHISVQSASEWMYNTPDIIFHLAAKPRIPISFGQPLDVIKDNAYSTAVILERARKLNTKVIYTTSSSTLGDRFANPYTYSKYTGEQYCKLYNKLYDVDVAIAMLFNVYGDRHVSEGDYATTMAIFEQQYIKGEPLTITGNGTQRRDFTHIHDIVEGLISISKQKWNADIIQLGRGKNYSVNGIAAMFGSEVEYISARQGEMKLTLADVAKTQEQLPGWIPRVSIKDYIKLFLETAEI